MIFTARCYASAVLAMGLCPSVCVCLLQAGVLLTRLNVGSHKQHHMIPQGLNDSIREFGIFARSVRVKLPLNCYATWLQRCVRHPPSSSIRILLDIEGDI